MKAVLFMALLMMTGAMAASVPTTPAVQPQTPQSLIEWFNVADEKNEVKAAINVKTKEVRYYDSDKDKALTALFSGYVNLQNQCQTAIASLQNPQKPLSPEEIAKNGAKGSKSRPPIGGGRATHPTMSNTPATPAKPSEEVKK